MTVVISSELFSGPGVSGGPGGRGSVPGPFIQREGGGTNGGVIWV